MAERIPNGATIQTGIGSIPNAILAALGDHRDLGVHTELLSDGLMDLVEAGVVTGVAKQLNRTKSVGTFALGTRRLYDFLDENTAFELWPVSYVNDPRVIAQEQGFVSINSTIAVDLFGQCASETVGGAYYSSSGGQADFARGAMYSSGGQGFVVLASTAKDDSISKIVSRLAPGDVVTTLKNTVDKVVTEWGVAELRGRSLRERARSLIAIVTNPSTPRRGASSSPAQPARSTRAPTSSPRSTSRCSPGTSRPRPTSCASSPLRCRADGSTPRTPDHPGSSTSAPPERRR